MISRVDLMTRCRPNFLYQIISAGRTDGHGGPHAARGPRVGRACSRRSHGPLLCAFCLCFHFKGRMVENWLKLAGHVERMAEDRLRDAYRGRQERRKAGEEEDHD